MWKKMAAAVLAASILTGAAWAADTAAVPARTAAQKPIVLETQGSFAIGGTAVKHDGTYSDQHFLEPQGQKAYGDHAYVFYQIPAQAKKYPIVFQHGGAQSKRTWETTPDGREGFQNIFLRKGYSVYLLDQPRIGEAGLATVPDNGANPYASNPMYADKALYQLCRVGTFDGDQPVPFKNTAFPKDAASYDQFQRTWTPYEGQLDDDVSADALAKLFDKIGPAVLVTHSMGGTVGWRTPFRTDNVKAIVAFEPGGSPFLFPEGEVPQAEIPVYAPVAAQAKAVPLKDFMKLTKIPIILYYGDNIADKPSKQVGPDKWRSEFDMAKKFVAAVNRHGGHAEIVHLPDIGIKGNTHFLMSDLNNQQIADLMANWLHKQGVDVW
ncbi:alpha/beta fold hydrolase [Megasphaera sp.]|uniref:alpha/beta hydrolase n=1 Tax=Megasphaera sp. TaxID=2023260 RepID=UPI003520C571